MQKWARLLYQPALPLNGKVPVTGSGGHIDVSKKAADESGCKWYIVEEDVCPGCPFDSLKQSYDYIASELF